MNKEIRYILNIFLMALTVYVCVYRLFVLFLICFSSLPWFDIQMCINGAEQDMQKTSRGQNLKGDVMSVYGMDVTTRPPRWYLFFLYFFIFCHFLIKVHSHECVLRTNVSWMRLFLKCIMYAHVSEEICMMIWLVCLSPKREYYIALF